MDVKVWAILKGAIVAFEHVHQRLHVLDVAASNFSGPPNKKGATVDGRQSVGYGGLKG